MDKEQNNNEQPIQNTDSGSQIVEPVQAVSAEIPSPPQQVSQPQTPPQYAQQPQFNPMPPQPYEQNRTVNTPGVIILQWLTYAFWGWTIFAISILSATVLASFISGDDAGYFALYPMASALVLLPISFVCDHFYSKYEPERKSGAATIVMVIHAVLFGILGIGSIVGIVISLLTMLINSSNTEGSVIALCTAIVTTILYTAIFLRVLNPPRFPWIRKAFLITMVVVVGGISILGIVGPVYKATISRNDKLIEQSLPSINQDISSYTRTNGMLPENLSDLNLTGDDAKLVDTNLIEYTPNTKPPTTKSRSSKFNNYDSEPKTYYYELCATFAAEKNSDYAEDNYNEEYLTYLSVYYHDEGRQCYKLQVTEY